MVRSWDSTLGGSEIVMSIALRPYQLECLEAIASNRAVGIGRQVIHLPTAAGKTIIFASLIAQTIEANPAGRVLVLAFSCDLLGQAMDKLHMIAPGLDVGIVDADHKEFTRQIVISSVQSARIPGNLERLQAQGFSICIADECHHFASDTARLVLDHLGFGFGSAAAGRLLIGFSATPFRSDSRGLGEIFDKIVYSKTIKEMIDSGYLCNPIGHKILTDLDLSKIPTERGDFVVTALSQAMNTGPLIQLVVESYLEKASGRKAIAFSMSIAHAEALAARFKACSLRCEAIHSNLPTDERQRLKTGFRKGEIDILVNPTMLTEGYDEPSIECVIIARPTKSAGLFQQMVGRGLRLYPNKRDCIVLYFGDQAHCLCTLGVLLGDQEEEKSDPKYERVKEIEEGLPPNLNQKLKKAIIDLDLLGESFTWQKDLDGQYYLKSVGGELKIIKRAADRYDAVMHWPDGAKVISEDLDFEYAFGAAEAFAKANRKLFAVSDLEAPWRKLPISEKQKDLFRSGGFRSGIDSLTRGQAAMIIGSRILRKKKSINKTGHLASF